MHASECLTLLSILGLIVGCRSASTPSLQESAPPADSGAVKAKLLTDVDVAALLGLVPEVMLSLVPLWYSPKTGADFAAIMVRFVERF